jgi:hypothetical protein
MGTVNTKSPKLPIRLRERLSKCLEEIEVILGSVEPVIRNKMILRKGSLTLTPQKEVGLTVRRQFGRIETFPSYGRMKKAIETDNILGSATKKSGYMGQSVQRQPFFPREF